MKKSLSLLLIMATTIICAQNTIKGIAKESESKEPIAFASVYLPELEKGTITNDKGEFVINNLPSGDYKIIISYIGYKTFSTKLKIPQTEPLKISLTPSAIEMEEIIISTPFHKLQSENVMKVEQIKMNELKASGATTLSEGITNIAGVESVTTGLSIGKPVIRGLSSNRVLVYTQGIRLENQQFGDEHGLGINAAGIESVEVIKGPASLLYGSDALGGVLYLNPEKFAQANSLTGDISADYFTNTLGFNTNLGFKSSGEKFKFILRGNITEHSDYKTDEFRVTNTRFKEQDFKTGIGYQTTNFKTELRYNLNNSKLGIPEEISVQSKNKTPLLPYQNIDNHIFSNKSTLFFNKSNLDINLGYVYNNRKEFEEHHEEEDDDDHEEESDEAALHMKLKTANYDIKYYLPKLGKLEIIAGVQGMNQTNSNFGEEELIPDATINDFGIFTISHIHFKKVDIQFGARYDDRNIKVKSGIEKDFSSFNGALGFKTNITNNFVARVNLATGFRSPNLSELTSDGIHHGTNRYEVGNENLKREQNFQTDIALEFKNEHIEFFVNGFYNFINDYIFLSPNGDIIDEAPVYTYLQDNAKLYGGEFGLHFHPHPLDWLHFESSFETVTGKQDDGSYLPLIPANKLDNTIRVEFNYDKKDNDLSKSYLKNSYAFIKLSTAFNQNNISDFETSTAGYSLLNIGLGGEFKISKHNLKVNISVTNLTNKVYVNHLSRLKIDNIPNIGRSFNFGINYNF